MQPVQMLATMMEHVYSHMAFVNGGPANMPIRLADQRNKRSGHDHATQVHLQHLQHIVKSQNKTLALGTKWLPTLKCSFSTKNEFKAMPKELALMRFTRHMLICLNLLACMQSRNQTIVASRGASDCSSPPQNAAAAT